MTLSELFKDLTEDKHCADRFAVNESGVSCEPNSRRARKWCAMGWVVRKSSTRVTEAKALTSLREYAKSLGFDGPSTANDTMGYDFIKSIQENCK